MLKKGGCQLLMIGTQHTRVYLMKNKSDFYNISVSFATMVTTQILVKIRYDSGREYLFTFSPIPISKSTTTTTIIINGVAECKYRHLQDIVRALLLLPSVPICFCGESILTAIYLINRLHLSSLLHSPREIVPYKTKLF